MAPRVLLVEDDYFFAQRISEDLMDHGVESHLVRTTQDAVALDPNDFAAAIVDLMLPNDPGISGISNEEARAGCMAGIAVIRRFKQKRSDFPMMLLSSALGDSDARKWARAQGYPFLSKIENRSRLITELSTLGLIHTVERPRSFIVHGHDEGLLSEMKDYIQNVLNWPCPVVLRNLPSCGKTIIEKFEENAGIVDWVFVLLSPDDPTFDPKKNDERRRARQNVVFELGFFYGLLGRHEGRVIALRKGDVEMPSDIQGVVWIDISNGIRAAGEDIRREVGM